MSKNPFISGNPVNYKYFINRSHEIKTAVSLLLTGQSFAIVGEPRSGKTSLLLYLQEPEKQKDLFPDEENKLSFFFLDFQAIPDDFTYTQFWLLALNKLVNEIKNERPRSKAVSIYQTFKKQKINTAMLDEFFSQIKEDGWHLVLLLDEFETTLLHPTLRGTEFYGGLRTIASRFGESLTLVISTRNSLSDLNIQTQDYVRSGSPFFNIFRELLLSPFGKQHSIELINQSQKRFNSAEKEYLLEVAGYHPYLLQSAASALWLSYEIKKIPEERMLYAGQELFRVASNNLERIWYQWTPNIRKVFTIIAIDEMPTLLGERVFDIESLRKSISSYPKEIAYLKGRGYLQDDDQLPGKYRVSAKVILWWLAEELMSALEKNDEIGHFLSKNQWEGLITKGEKDQLFYAIDKLNQIAKTGVETFIKAAAEGFGKGVSSG